MFIKVVFRMDIIAGVYESSAKYGVLARLDLVSAVYFQIVYCQYRCIGLQDYNFTQRWLTECFSVQFALYSSLFSLWILSKNLGGLQINACYDSVYVLLRSL